MAKKSLQNFIKNYLNSRLTSESEEDYSSWKRKNGINTTATLSKELTDADTEYQRSLAGYGRLGEQIGSLGLNKSGYAAFLNDVAGDTLKKRIISADKSYGDAELKGRKGYSEYIKATSEAKSKLIKEAKSHLADKGFTNYDDAYAAATEMGLSEKEADSLAKESTEKAVKNARLKVISAIVNKRYSGKQAKEYATALGLSVELADELAELAESTNREIDLGKAEGYLEYLKSLDAQARAK